ncbi:MAG: DoxX family membrane protein [Acidobacteriia bacterium]|jgi:thiosulfate dehydrogenase [quinone] large subunit|nr:DoxX family membrane protein [Terriglobia bacterium]
MLWKRITVAGLRILLGGWMLYAGLAKLLDPGFLYGGLLHRLSELGRPFGFYDHYILSRYVNLHEELFAYAVSIGEILVGVSLVSGALVSLGVLGGCFLMLNFALATGAGDPATLLLHGVLTGVFIFLGVVGAGVWWGVDGWLTRYINEAVVLFPFRRTLPNY